MPSPGHALTDIEQGEYDDRDITHSILTGSLRKVEADDQRRAVDGKIYTIVGEDRRGLAFGTVGKMIKGPQGKVYFLITAFAWR